MEQDQKELPGTWKNKKKCDLFEKEAIMGGRTVCCQS